MEPAELSTVLKHFYVEARNVEGKPYSRNTMKAIRSGLDRFLSGSPQKKPFSIIRDKAFKPANEALDASLKDLARQGLISSTKHKRPISNEDLEALYAANQLGVKPGFHIIVRIVRIVRIVPVVSKKMFRRPGRSYGNAIQTIANDPDDWDDLDRLDRIEFYPDDRGDRVNFESPGSFAIVWVAFPYDRPGRLKIFFETTGTIGTIRTIGTIIWKPGLNTPESLVNTAWFYTILYFGKRDRENQRAMKPGDLQLKTTTSGLKYFVLRERATKNHPGRVSDNEDESQSVMMAGKSPLSRGLPWEVLGKKRSTMRCHLDETEKPQCELFPFSRWSLVL